MLERIVFHIGTHKTGTTAIQVSLGEAYEDLLARGILYPRAGRWGPGHALLAREILSTDAPPALAPSHLGILEEARAAQPATLLVSSEELLGVGSPRPVEWARELCEELQPARVHVLGYVRPQWERIESAYAMWIRTGRSWEPFESAVERMMVNKRFDYLETFEPWRQAFGESLELRPYGADLLLGADAVTDFWNAVGLGAPTEAPRQENARPGARTTEMLRLLRAFLADHRLDALIPVAADPHPRPQQRAVQELLRRARGRIEAAFPDDRPYSPLTQEMVARIAARYSDSNERLVQTYFAGRHEGLFSPPSEPRVPSTWTMSEASTEELSFFAQLVGETLAELGSRSAGTADGASAGAPRRHPATEGEARPLTAYLRRAQGRLRQLVRPLRRG